MSKWRMLEMKCKKCNQEIREGALFCGQCGEKVEQQEGKDVSSNMKLKKIMMLLGAIVALVVIVFVYKITSNTVIDLADVYEVKFSGLNKEGTAEIILNEQEMESISYKLYEESEMSELIHYFTEIEYEITPAEGLSNGDEIKVVAKYIHDSFEKSNFKFKNIEQTIKVEGLIEPQEIDVFEGLKVEYRGRSPYIICSFDKSDCSDFVKEFVEFTATENYYAIDDTVNVIAEYDYDDCVEKAVKVIKDETEYIAESKEAYIDSIENVDLSKVHEAIAKQLQLEYSAADELFCGVELGWTNHITGVKEENYVDEVFMTLKEIETYDEETPYNIYGKYYRIKIGVEHRSRGNESTFDTEVDVLLLAKDLWTDENGELHFDELIEVRATEVEGLSDLLSTYQKEKQGKYSIK